LRKFHKTDENFMIGFTFFVTKLFFFMSTVLEKRKGDDAPDEPESKKIKLYAVCYTLPFVFCSALLICFTRLAMFWRNQHSQILYFSFREATETDAARPRRRRWGDADAQPTEAPTPVTQPVVNSTPAATGSFGLADAVAKARQVAAMSQKIAQSLSALGGLGANIAQAAAVAVKSEPFESVKSEFGKKATKFTLDADGNLIDAEGNIVKTERNVSSLKVYSFSSTSHFVVFGSCFFYCSDQCSTGCGARTRSGCRGRQERARTGTGRRHALLRSARCQQASGAFAWFWSAGTVMS
jgi:hypothetical protein